MDADAQSQVDDPSAHVDLPSVDQSFSWRRSPLELSDRLGVRPSSVVSGVLAVVAVGFGGWWALRPPPPPVEETLPIVSDVSLATSSTTTQAPLILVVHVDGAVAHAGVHEVVAGSRVIDAVEAAGGLTTEADRSRINLAQLVADGQRVWVPSVGEDAPPAIVGPGVGVGGTTDAAGQSVGRVVSLSEASPAELESLPGIGPSLAAAIVEHREREGAFGRVDDLLAVSGIGPAKLDAIRDLVVP